MLLFHESFVMFVKYGEKRKGQLLMSSVNDNCQINHNGTSGSMNTAGAVEIFGSSNAKYNLRYSKYLGDGDTASFTKVVESQPYGDELKPVKLECVGDYQKRTGNRLRQKRKETKGVKISDGKGITQRGRLTDIVINTLQNYVGMEIRQNDITEMRNSIIATLYHCTTFQYEEPRHLFCSNVKNSLCKWQSHIATLYHCTTFQYEEPRHLFCSKVKNSRCKWQSHITTGKQTKIEFTS